MPAGPVLDVAAGDGRNALWLAPPRLAVTAIDIAPAAIARLRRRCRDRAARDRDAGGRSRRARGAGRARPVRRSGGDALQAVTGAVGPAACRRCGRGRAAAAVLVPHDAARPARLSARLLPRPRRARGAARPHLRCCAGRSATRPASCWPGSRWAAAPAPPALTGRGRGQRGRTASVRRLRQMLASSSASRAGAAASAVAPQRRQVEAGELGDLVPEHLGHGLLRQHPDVGHHARILVLRRGGSDRRTRRR